MHSISILHLVEVKIETVMRLPDFVFLALKIRGHRFTRNCKSVLLDDRHISDMICF